MKHLLLVLFAGLLLNVHVFAQWDYESDDYDYEYVDSEYADTGEPVQTNITITNTGDENSSYDIQSNKKGDPQPINIYFYNMPQPAVEQPVQNATPSPPPAKPDPPPAEPIIEYRYIPLTQPEPPPPPAPPAPPPPPQIEYIYLPSPPEYIYLPPPPPPPVEYIYFPPPPPQPPPPPPPPPVVPIYLQTSPVQIRVIPALPAPNSSRVYRLQVGSYAVHNTADMVVQRLRDAGLLADMEYFNSLKRVFVPGVRAADVGSIVQILGTLGFEEIWIRE